MMLFVQLVLHLFISHSLGDIVPCANKTTIVFYAVSSLTNSQTGHNILHAQQLYIHTKTWRELFPQYDFHVQLFDAKADDIISLKIAINITRYYQNNLVLENNCSNSNSNSISDDDDINRQLLFPFILGCAWSSQSIITAPVFSAYNFGQLSSSSTSPTLSNTDKFGQFFRLAPNDIVSARGVVHLCQTFNWKSIEILYINNNYGEQFAASVSQIAIEYDIQTQLNPFDPNQEKYSFTNAATKLKNSGMCVHVYAHANAYTLRDFAAFFY